MCVAAGRKRLLSYRIAPAAGQRVTFFEKGARTYRRLGVARGTRGRIRFAPAAGRRGRREIVAQIERNGVVVKNLVVARYSAARDPRPARPRGLRVRRRGDALVVAWRRARAAFRYGVTVQLSNRRRIFRVTRRRRIAIRGVDRRARGVVLVGGLRADGVGGREAKRRIPKPKSTKRRKR